MSDLYDVIPLNPLVQLVKEVFVFPSYKIISESILIIPFVSGNPYVDATLITSSVKSTLSVKKVDDGL